MLNANLPDNRHAHAKIGRGQNMRKAIAILMLLTLVSLPLMAGEDEEREDKRLANCGKILNEILNEPEHGMPQFILDRAYCVIMLPGTKKGNGFIFTAGFGAHLDAAR